MGEVETKKRLAEIVEDMKDVLKGDVLDEVMLAKLRMLASELERLEKSITDARIRSMIRKILEIIGSAAAGIAVSQFITYLSSLGSML